MIRPWKDIIPKEQWENMLNRGVLPKLVFYADSLKIRPESQEIKIIKELLKWSEIMGKEQIEIAFEGVFKKLDHAFNEWMIKPGKRVEEMIIWVNGWEGMLKSVTNKIAKSDFFKKMKVINF